MKKSNVILQAAISSALLAMVGSANAGTMTGAGTVYAAENFKSGGTNITLPKATTQMPMTYSFSSSTTLNPSSVIVLTLRLANSTFTAAPVAADFKLGGTTAGTVVSATAPAVAFAISTDKSTITATFTSMSGGTTTLGLGGIIYTPSVGGITASNTALSVSGANITASAAITLTTPTAGTYEATMPMPSTIDLPAVTGAVVASTLQAVSVSTDALMAGYAAKIDLTANPIKSDYTSSTGVGAGSGGTPVSAMAMGDVIFTNASTLPIGLTAAGATYSILQDSATTAHTATIDVTPGAGQAFPIGAVLSYDTTTACATRTAPLTAFTATTALTKATLTVTSGLTSTTAGATATVYVCMTKPSSGNTASPITATLTGTLVPTVAADASPTATGTGYAVVYNGSSVAVRNYIPHAVTGFVEIVRISNTGSVAAAPTITMKSESGAAIGTAFTGASLAAGATRRYTQTEIETGVGATAATLLSTDRPRLTVTAPTNGLDVQTIMYSNGVYTNLSGTE